jgi:hypothetical protein
MRFVHRVRQLERVRALASPSTLMERFQRALDKASVRLTGKCFDQISGDDAAVELVLNDLSQSFVRQLDDSELETLSGELARVAFGGDAEALAAAEREVLSLDAVPQGGAIAPGRSS